MIYCNEGLFVLIASWNWHVKLCCWLASFLLLVIKLVITCVHSWLNTCKKSKAWNMRPWQWPFLIRILPEGSFAGNQLAKYLLNLHVYLLIVSWVCWCTERNQAKLIWSYFSLEYWGQKDKSVCCSICVRTQCRVAVSEMECCLGLSDCLCISQGDTHAQWASSQLSSYPSTPLSMENITGQ